MLFFELSEALSQSGCGQVECVLLVTSMRDEKTNFDFMKESKVSAKDNCNSFVLF